MPDVRFIASPPVVFGIASFVAIGLGLVAGAMSGLALSGWVMGLAAWLVGAGLAFGLSRAGRVATSPAVVLIALIALGLTFIGPGQEGVHRWLAIGPFTVNVAFLALPLAAVALAANRDSAAVWIGALAILAVLAAQPDASQATAWFAVVVVAALSSAIRWTVRAPLLLLSLAVTVFAWLRPDPLEPVAQVEDVLELAWAASPVLAVAGGGAVLAACLAPVMKGRTAPALALSAYFAATLATTAFGAFPVPLMGVGMGPILGFWIGVGALMAVMNRENAGLLSPGSRSF